MGTHSSNKNASDSARHKLREYRRDDTKNVLKAVGACLRARRKAERYTIAALAEIAGVNATYLGEAERGHGNVSMDFVTKVCRAVDLSLRDVMPEESVREFIRRPVQQ